MREIKFRGKSINCEIRNIGKINFIGSWVYGSLLDQRKINGRMYIESYNTAINTIVKNEVDPKTVGQYTGFKDKNGVEIYEGVVLPATDL